MRRPWVFTTNVCYYYCIASGNCIFLKQNNKFLVFDATNIGRYITEINRERMI